MKNTKLFLLLFITSLLSSCEEVVYVDLNTAPARLVIEASIVWDKGTSGSEQMIKLSTTTDYYDTVIPTVSNAIVTVEAASGTIFNFVENGNTGQYICTNFIPVLDETYTLSVILNNEIYIATEILQSVVPYDFVEQIENGGLDKDEIEIRAYFTDPKDIENYYLVQRSRPIELLNEYNVLNDKFFNGNQTYNSFVVGQINRDFDFVHIINFKLYGISKEYYNYLNVLLGNMTDEDNPFISRPPGIFRGNIINTTNPDNYCLGFFNLSEADNLTYTVQ